MKLTWMLDAIKTESIKNLCVIELGYGLGILVANQPAITAEGSLSTSARPSIPTVDTLTCKQAA